MSRSFLMIFTVFAIGCGNDPEGSTCLQLWNEFGEVSSDLLCADYIGEHGDEVYTVSIFTEENIEVTGPTSFALVDTLHGIFLTQPGDHYEVDCPSGEIAYLCIDPGAELSLMGPKLGYRQVTMFDGEVRTLLCAFGD